MYSKPLGIFILENLWKSYCSKKTRKIMRNKKQVLFREVKGSVSAV